MGPWILAITMALLHGLLTVFLVAGAPLAARRPRLMRWYLAMLAPTAAVNILGWPCPLTVWEKDFWRLADQTPYRGGFISHYFVEPFYSPGLGPGGDTALLVAMVLWCTPWLIVSAFGTRSRVRPTEPASTAADNDAGCKRSGKKPLRGRFRGSQLTAELEAERRAEHAAADPQPSPIGTQRLIDS